MVMQRRVFLAALRDSVLLLPVANLPDAVAGRDRDRSDTVAANGDLKLFLAGDVMTGRGIDQVLPYPSDPVLYEDYVRDARDYVRLAEREHGLISKPVDEDYIWGEALNVWNTQKPDLRIINLETSVTASDDAWAGKGIHYRMHPRNVDCLSAAGIDCCVLANNHVMDWGYSGLSESLATLRVAGIQTAGAGRSYEAALRPARLHVPGKGDVLVFAVADASSGVPRSWAAEKSRGGIHLLDDISSRSAQKLADHIEAERQPDDIVVLSIHWGGNWGYRVLRHHRYFAHFLIDSGVVDVVHGHSSHHAKALEYYKDKVILYGCGDFVNDYEGIGGREEFRPWLAPMYFLTVNTRSHRVERIEIEVMRIRRFRLMRASAQDRRWLLAKLNEVSTGFATCLESSDERLVASACATAAPNG